MRLSVLSSAGAYMLGVYGGIALIGVGSIRLFTELAPPAVFGEANLLLTVMTLAIAISSQPFTNTQLRYHSAAVDRGEADAFTRSVLTWTVTAGGGIFLLAILIWSLTGGAHNSSLGLGGLLGLGGIIFATSVRNVLFGRTQAERRNFTYGGLLLAEAALIAGGIALGLRLHASVDGYVIGNAAGIILAATLGLAAAPQASVRMITTRERDPAFLGQVRSYGLPFVPIGVMSWLANLADRYVLGAVAGPAAAGRYMAPFSIASRGMGLFGGALTDILRPVLFAAANKGDTAAAQRVFWLWLAVRGLAAVAGVAGAWLLGPVLIQVLLAPAYRAGAVPILMWIATAYGIQGMIQTLETRLMSFDRTRWLIPPLAVGGIANLVFSLLLVPRYGALGAAEATTASFTVQAAVTALLVWRARRRG